jgi:hypothetical protein
MIAANCDSTVALRISKTSTVDAKIIGEVNNPTLDTESSFTDKCLDAKCSNTPLAISGSSRMTYSGDKLMEMVLNSFLLSYCPCDLNALSSAIFGVTYSAPVYSAPQYDPMSGDIFGCYNPYIQQVGRICYDNPLLLSKNELNLEMLKQFRYTTETRNLPNGRYQTVYVCKKEGCDKEFMRTCNLLDHARMHSGIKPNFCSF